MSNLQKTQNAIEGAAEAAFDDALAAPPAKPAALDAGEAAKLIANLREGRCDPGPTSDPRECELPDDECDCLMRANAADALEAATRQRDDAREALREIAKLGAYVVPQRIAERALAALSPDSAASGEGDAP